MGMPGPLWVTGTDPDMTGGSGKIQSQLIQVSKLSGIRIHTEATLNKKLHRNVLQNIFRLLPNVSSRFLYSWSSTIHILILLLRFWFSMCYSSQFLKTQLQHTMTTDKWVPSLYCTRRTEARMCLFMPRAPWLTCLMACTSSITLRTRWRMQPVWV